MKREEEYRQLANDTLQRDFEEQSAILRAQWEILSASSTEVADQSKKVEEISMTRSRGTGCGDAIEF